MKAETDLEVMRWVARRVFNIVIEEAQVLSCRTDEGYLEKIPGNIRTSFSIHAAGPIIAETMAEYFRDREAFFASDPDADDILDMMH